MKIQNSMFFIKRSCSILSRAKTFRSLRKLLVVALAFLLWVPVTHSQNEVGDIHGKLTDSKQNEPIANHPVILNIHKAGDVTQQETTTDENGTYRFENLPIDFETHYSLSTTYNGVEHTEKDLVLSSLVPNLLVDLNVGEVTDKVTDDSSQIRVKSYTILIGLAPEQHAKEGAVAVNEFLNVENLNISPFQIIREKEAVGFSFDLPERSKEFQPRNPKSLKRSATGNYIVLDEPLPHGATVIWYDYLFHANTPQNASSLELDLSRRMQFRTDEISILVQDGINLTPHSKYFKQTKSEAINNVVYKAYAAVRGVGFSEGEIVDLKLGVPKPQSNIGQMVFIACAAALAGGFLVAAIFMLRGAQRVSEESDDGQSVSTDAGWLRKLSDVDLEHARATRLEFITRLDEMHEEQNISERVYNRLRKEQTERLTEILNQRQERGLNN